jgi:hypothetical protein
VLCSAGAGAAPTITALVVARLAQGAAAGCLAPQNSALIQQMFSGAERGRAFGFFGAGVRLSWLKRSSQPITATPRTAGAHSDRSAPKLVHSCETWPSTSALTGWPPPAKVD